MSRSLPPNLSAAQFDLALASWRSIVGEPQVVTSAAGLATYLDPFAPGERAAFSASATLLPGSVDEIRAVLRVANQYRIPLWTVSTGRNFAYGGAAPRLPGSVVLDLHRMNRIIEVNETLAYALVEPGVTYFDLHAYLREHGHKLWVDPPAAGWGSVVGNTLERGFGYTAYGDHAAKQCGMEVVLANGDVLRTGMGGIEIGTAWQLYQPGYGPSFDAMFMQSNYGIVTKLGVWLMPAPPAYLLGEIQFQHEADLEAIVEILRPLRLDETIRNHVVIEGGLRRAAGLSTRAQWYEGPGAMPERAVAAMLEKLDVGRWNLHFALYGTPELIDARLAIVQRAFARVPQARFFAKRYAGNAMGDAAGNAASDAQPTAGGDRNLAGIPAMSAFRMLDWRGGAGAHVDFAPVCPATGRDALRQYTMVKTRAAEYGFDYYGGFTAGERHLHHIFAAIFDRGDANQVEQAGQLLRSLMSDARAAGYGEYRAHLAYMDFAAAQYSFNDGALLRLSETIKDALDPNGILAPGKQGIWPAAWRDRRGYT
ncbi:p-cresol methylhydroxylase [Paraburkholderia ginsengiterrae]|uniref:p-cresol methylhydroxylase n=1 Tax=Paraburkholderia ginsengiterrae TaxID=1462993 RepID=A0A1A9MZE5_9BURK|nr:FAD-binding oxidoreductase [Paraburkholderia ginsengiterrae]OAJ54407.1 p-cresol methylhydroxylase [Paraburkholderia ginsengiterrae]OAJ56216.1 p-cresol methylhydroxylase [Paraburkholderia ginsengiterrae]